MWFNIKSSNINAAHSVFKVTCQDMNQRDLRLMVRWLIHHPLDQGFSGVLGWVGCCMHSRMLNGVSPLSAKCSPCLPPVMTNKCPLGEQNSPPPKLISTSMDATLRATFQRHVWWTVKRHLGCRVVSIWVQRVTDLGEWNFWRIALCYHNEF